MTVGFKNCNFYISLRSYFMTVHEYGHRIQMRTGKALLKAVWAILHAVYTAAVPLRSCCLHGTCVCHCAAPAAATQPLTMHRAHARCMATPCAERGETSIDKIHDHTWDPRTKSSLKVEVAYFFRCSCVKMGIKQPGGVGLQGYEH